MSRLRIFCSCLFFLSQMNVYAQDSSGKPQVLNLHFQTTYIYQYKPSFHSPYEGQNSLKGNEEEQNSITATLGIGLHPWKGTELYFSPELAGGSGLSGALGMAGSSNGETFRVGDPAPTLYRARYFIKQTFGLNKDLEWQADEMNQVSGYVPVDRLSLYLGKFSLGDLFDNNEYSNSPRTQFMNWSLMNTGTWDYAANVRGYTYALAAELKWKKYRYLLAFASLPKEANGPILNLNFDDSFSLGINAEIDRQLSLNGRKGNVRLLAFHNTAPMGSYSEALKMAVPNVVATRQLYRTKWGVGLNFDQELKSTVGLFGRFGWTDGHNETWAFTEIERTAALGLSFPGKQWKRNDDNAGVAVVFNGLSDLHREYLKRGGYGFMIGDGSLNYGMEEIAEWYYNYKPPKIPLWFTADYQFVLHPGYNKDRGPVNIFSFRLHSEF